MANQANPGKTSTISSSSCASSAYKLRDELHMRYDRRPGGVMCNLGVQVQVILSVQQPRTVPEVDPVIFCVSVKPKFCHWKRRERCPRCISFLSGVSLISGKPCVYSFVLFILCSKNSRFSESVFCLEKAIPPNFLRSFVLLGNFPKLYPIFVCNISESEPAIFEMNCP